MKKFKIYFPFTLNEIKALMSYRGSFYVFLFISLFGSFIAYFLWTAIYKSADSPILGGMTKEQMVVYIFMTYATGRVVSSSVTDMVSEDIVKGTVSMNLIKPIDYRWSLIARSAGSSIFMLCGPCLLIIGGVEIYMYKTPGLQCTDLSTIVLFLISCVMSFMIYVLFDFCFGMIAFFTTYIFGMILAKEALMGFLTGQLIPLTFFPESIRGIFELLPFSSMIYTPVMIFLGKYTGSELATVMIRQAVWVIILYLLGSLIWRRVTRRLVVLGG